VYVKVRVETTSDREIEFFRFKVLVDGLINLRFGADHVKNLGSMSMETVGLHLLEDLKLEGFNSSMVISVSEDNQVRSIIESDGVK